MTKTHCYHNNNSFYSLLQVVYDMIEGANNDMKKIIFIMFTMFITAFGIHLMIEAQLGLNPWWTLTTALQELTHIPLGILVQMLGLIMIVLAFLLGRKPGIVTIMDMFLIGFYLDILKFLPSLNFNAFVLKLMVFTLGIAAFVIGITMTISQNLGAGPKDSFTLALTQYFKKEYSHIRLIMDASIFALGVLLGGPFGLGTILCTVLTGKLMQYAFKWIGYDPTQPKKPMRQRRALRY